MKTNIIIILRQFLSLLLTCGLATAATKPELQKIRYTILSPTSEQVSLQLNGSYIPKIFTLKDETTRIVFDFPDMVYGRGVKSISTTNGTIVKRIRVGMHTEEALKTRIVFDVVTLKGVTYTQKFDNESSSLIIQFSIPAKAAALGGKTKTASPADGHKSKSADAAEKSSETKPQITETVPTQPEAPADSIAVTKTETAQAESNGEVKPETKEPSLQSKATTEKAEEIKTPAPTVAPSQPEATAVETQTTTQTKTTQTDSNIKSQPVAQEKSSKQTITVEKAEEERAPAPTAAPSQPEATAEKPQVTTQTKTTQTESNIKSQPVAQEKPSEQTITAKKAEEEKAPAPAATLPQPDIATGIKPSTTTEASKPAVPSGAGVGPLLESVKFDGTSPKGEMVLFKLNDFHPPVIHGVVEGVPRVICDFNSTQLLNSVKNLIKVDGKFIKIIRITKHKKPDRIRVVLDLEPNRSYDLQQVFFKEDNLFVIIVNTIKK